MSRPFARASLLFSLTFAATLGPGPISLHAESAAKPGVPDKPIALEEALALALQKNFNLQIQAFNVENAKENVVIQESSVGDPTLTASINRNVQQAASSTSRLDGTTFVGPRNDGTTMRVGATLPRITATNAVVNVSTNVTRNATNSTNSLVNPSFGNGVTATLAQPLLRDFGRQAALAALESARLSFTIATINYRSNVLAVVNNTENAYYNLIAARDALRIRQLTLEGNQRLYEENQARRSSGIMTDLDVLSAQVGVERSRSAVVQQEQTLRDAEEQLLLLINAPSFDVRPVPEPFSDYKEGAPSFAQSYKLARDFYPARLSAEQTIKQLELNLDTTRRSTKPNLDLTATLGYNAKTTSAGYSEAISNLPHDHGNNWALNLNYIMPWGMHADKARFRQATNSLQAQKIQLEQLEQQLIASVRSAVRGIETNVVAVEIATKATELAARQYEQQKARFDAGLSTSRIVLQFQDDLESARFTELTAKLQLRRAVAALRQLEGSSLERFKLQAPALK
ncbi:MAG: TolC family protein [Opitutus sp.]|nr:TolC family protein [Opitutus sp.]